MHTGLAVLGAFLFSAFIIFDTQMIMKHLNAEGTNFKISFLKFFLHCFNII